MERRRRTVVRMSAALPLPLLEPLVLRLGVGIGLGSRESSGARRWVCRWCSHGGGGGDVGVEREGEGEEGGVEKRAERREEGEERR